MNDIKPGDLVVYLGPKLPRHPPCPLNPLIKGNLYRAESILPRDCDGDHGLLLIGRRSSHATGGYKLNSFRKLNDEPDNAELIALIKRPILSPTS